MVRKIFVHVAFIFITTAFPELPTFSAPQSIANVGIGNFGGEFYSPVHYDWDGDDDRDMLVGYFGDSGRVRYFENTGDDISPGFQDKGDMEAGGGPIIVGGV